MQEEKSSLKLVESAKTEVKNARNGKGLFAKHGIMKGVTIFTVTGNIAQVSYEVEEEGDLKAEARWFGIDRETWLVPNESNPMYYMNHSCNPNCVIANKTQVIALREIGAGEELTFDYSTTEEDPYWEMPCNCGYKFCRKLIAPAAKFTSNKIELAFCQLFL
jgi:SET domain-containing protein